MNLLPLFEFLTYFLPGFIAVETIRLVWSEYAPWNSFDLIAHSTETENTLILLVSSIMAGFFIHRITGALMHVQFYRNRIRKSYAKIAKESDEMKSIAGKLNPYCLELTGRSFDSYEENSVSLFFHHAWYFLEAHEKNASSKNFQSFFHFFCSCFTMALPMLIVLIAFTKLQHLQPVAAILFICLMASLLAARYCRKKWIERVFWLYYVIKEDTIKKEPISGGV